jgi:hypothetical protein
VLFFWRSARPLLDGLLDRFTQRFIALGDRGATKRVAEQGVEGHREIAIDLVALIDEQALEKRLVELPSHRRRRVLERAAPGDASEFVGDTVPHGTAMRPGQGFEKRWEVRNTGAVLWRGRRLERQGPRTGPGIITSLEFIDVPETPPGEIATISTGLKAPTYDCASIAYFKMVDSDRRMCFPDNYQLGLDVLIVVRGQKPDNPSELEMTGLID